MTKQWPDAEQYCMQLGGHLISVHSAEENNDIRSTTPTNDTYYIGCNDRNDQNTSKNNEGNITWSDGTLFNYQNLLNGSNSNIKDCCTMLTDGSWQISECSNISKSICRIPGIVIL